ncbi:calcium-binding protein [Actinoplanes xinjiangensis]|uniref:Hemolysin type calcium-binding protein n=1 Tax=Actinoplanes xinjiangensis TaxID=512350 RepID=A0A316FA56_9ACTN|nr:calcium-binding protein [Actinoplanes xinjiangensis]PWK43584.1 hemolysin type calcium-binding protein [Actinoplanes xinjiangensis]GIF41903.1 hypothetical protein Axi01nite_62140 [Actinoplanes xinjiangensis]
MFVNRRTLSAIGVAALAVVAAPFLLSSPASAAGAGSVKVVGTGKVQFQASSGSVNSLTMTISGRTVTLDDRVAIKAGRGCKAVKGDRTKVRCTTSKATAKITVSLGDRNDTLRNKTSVALDATGGSGADTLIGGSGPDYFRGGTSGDRLYGNGGVDQLNGESSADRISGGAGDDWISGDTGGDRIWGDAGHDKISSDSGDDIVAGGDGNDRVYGFSGNDTLYGQAGDDELAGGSGDDNLWGSIGADMIEGGGGDDHVWAGSGGFSSYTGRIATDVVAGGAGNDVLYGEGDNDFLVGEHGDDTVEGGAGDDWASGGVGNDTIRGGDGDDLLAGERIHEYIGLLEDAAAVDRVDGGAGTTAGDVCYVTASSTVAGCEAEPDDGGDVGMKRRGSFDRLSMYWS